MKAANLEFNQVSFREPLLVCSEETVTDRKLSVSFFTQIVLD